MKIKGVAQIGCHHCEEHSSYLEQGIDKFFYVEPCREAFETTIEKFLKLGYRFNKKDLDKGYIFLQENNIKICNCACGSETKKDVMYVSNDNQGQSNSLLKPKLHLEQHPEIHFNESEIVQVVRLDELPFNREDYNLLVLDCQGSDGDVLLGATETLKHIDYICMEVNRDEVYEGNMLIGDVDKLLSEFTRVETEWCGNWGDSWYIRTSLLN
jgi:FkbM family methyltransferase